MNTEELSRFVSDGFERAKRGEASTVYTAVTPFFENGLLPSKSHYPFGWIIYYALHQAPAHAIAERKQMLARYLKLTLRKPHKLHSMILLEAIRLAKDSSAGNYPDSVRATPESKKQNSFSIVRFLPLWNPENLREGDWRRKEQEGKILNSTVEKLITVYVNELDNTRGLPSEEFMQIIEKGLRTYPDSGTLMAQSAILHELKGEKEQAVNFMRKAILSAPAKFHLWSRMASLLGREKYSRLYAAFLSKALSIPGPEEYKGRIRLSLAELMIEHNSPDQALFELEQVKRIYESNSWHLPRLYSELQAKVPQGTTPADPHKAYRILNLEAENFIYSALPPVMTRKTYHKEASEGADKFGNHRRKPVAWRVADEKGNNYWLTPRQFMVAEDLPLGTRVCIRLYNGKVVSANVILEAQ